MISLPLYPFLFAYFFFLLAWIIFFFINVGHLVHTGTFTLASFVVTFFFIAFSAFVFFFTILLLQNTDWRTPMVFFNSSSLNGIFPSP